jgi:hypothetical protein
MCIIRLESIIDLNRLYRGISIDDGKQFNVGEVGLDASLKMDLI